MQCVAAYDRALTRRPLVVKTLTSAAMFGLGDFMSQKLEGLPEIDTKRMVRMIGWGAMFAPMAHGWYNLLEARLPAKGIATVVKKVAADQLIFTPPLNSLFFFVTTAMATGSPEKGIQQIKDKLWPTLQVNWVVWPVLQGINMSLVPLAYRVLFVNFASLFWSAFLSNMANAEEKQKGGAATIMDTVAAEPPSKKKDGEL